MDSPKDIPPFSRRQYARYPCQLPAKITVSNSTKPLDGEITNISLGGAFLCARGALPQSFSLEFSLGETTVSAQARVAYNAGNDRKDSRISRYGLAFQLSKKNELKLKTLIDQLRTGVRGPEMKRDYWST